MRLRPFIAPTAREQEKAKQFDAIESTYGYPQRLLDVMWFHESTRGKQTHSSAGATTDFQFMPGTAKEIKAKHGIDVTKGTQEAAKGCAAYLNDMGKEYKLTMFESVCAYNCGPGRVKRMKEKYGDEWFEHVPVRTQAYALAIFKELGYDKEEALALEKKPRDSKAALLAKHVNGVKINPIPSLIVPAADSTDVALTSLQQILADTTRLAQRYQTLAFAEEANQNTVIAPTVQKPGVIRTAVKEAAVTK